MSRIRGNFKLVAIVIFVCVAIFVLTGLFQNAGRSRSNAAGEIAGEEVSYDELQFRAQQIEESQRSPAMDRNNLMTQAWQQIIQDRVLGKEYASAGIEVSGEELQMLFIGPYMSGLVKQRFVDSTGQRTDTALIMTYLNTYKNPNMSNPQHVNAVNLMRILETDVEKERLTGKIVGLLQGAVFVSANEARTRYNEELRMANGTLFAVYYSSIPDNEIKATDNDLRDFYNTHKERFATENPGIMLKYAYLKKTPSAADTAATVKLIDGLKDNLKAAKGKDLLTFALNTTDVPFDTNYQSLDVLGTRYDASALIAGDGKDTVIGPSNVGGNYKIYRVAGSLPLDAPLFQVRHILLRVPTPTAKDTADTRKKANELRAKANKDNFSQLVAENSADQMSQTTGGEIGWINATTRGQKMYDAAKAAGAGNFAVTESQEGIHVIYVVAKSDRKYQVAEISKSVAISDETEQALFQQAAEFMNTALELKSIDSAARKSKARVMINQTPELTPEAANLDGVQGGRQVITWGFRSNLNEITPEIKEVDDAYVIAQVISKHDKGYREFESVKEEIRPEVNNHLRAKKIMARLKGMDTKDLNALAQSYGAGATASPLNGVIFSNDQAPMIGSEPFVQGTLFGLAAGETSPVIEGKTGVFIVRAESFKEAEPLDGLATKARQTQYSEAKRRSYLPKAYQAMVWLADIYDQRYLYE